MRISKLIAGAALWAIVVYSACRKVDVAHEQSHDALENKFFNQHRSTDPLVQELTKYVQQENEKFHFVEKVVERIGFPIWDKAIVREKKSSAGKGQTESGNVSYIPFVQENENYVNASLIITTTPTDTTYSYLCDWQYDSFNYGNVMPNTVTAEKAALVMMQLDNAVFGYTDFRITDSLLFNINGVSTTSRKQVRITPPSSVGNKGNGTAVADLLIVCIRVQTGGCNCEDPNRCDFCLQYCAWEVCLEIEVEVIFWGGGGGTGTGGGSGNGSGWTPPSSGCGGVQTKGTVQEGCGSGWTGGGGTGGSSQPPPNDSTIAANLNRTYLKVKNVADSLFTLGQGNQKEFTFTLTRPTTTDTIAADPHPGQSGNSEPTMLARMFGYWHMHFKANFVDVNQSFDGPDIFKMYRDLVKGYNVELQLLTTTDYIYAAVITDQVKFKNHIKSICPHGNYFNAIEEDLHNIWTDAINACTTCGGIYEKESEAGVMAITAQNNASVSGIKIFKSPRNNINFTPLQ